MKICTDAVEDAHVLKKFSFTVVYKLFEIVQTQEHPGVSQKKFWLYSKGQIKKISCTDVKNAQVIETFWYLFW